MQRYPCLSIYCGPTSTLNVSEYRNSSQVKRSLTNSSHCRELFACNASARARAPLSVIRLSTCSKHHHREPTGKMTTAFNAQDLTIAIRNLILELPLKPELLYQWFHFLPVFARHERSTNWYQEAQQPLTRLSFFNRRNLPVFNPTPSSFKSSSVSPFAVNLKSISWQSYLKKWPPTVTPDIKSPDLCYELLNVASDYLFKARCAIKFQRFQNWRFKTVLVWNRDNKTYLQASSLTARIVVSWLYHAI